MTNHLAGGPPAMKRKSNTVQKSCVVYALNYSAAYARVKSAAHTCVALQSTLYTGDKVRKKTVKSRYRNSHTRCSLCLSAPTLCWAAMS